MMLKILRYGLKWPFVILAAGYIGYNFHDNINRFFNEVDNYPYVAEEGFVDKNVAFRLKIGIERNNNGNLETYLLSNGDPLPIYSRDNGIMVGNAQYNFSNLTGSERNSLCACRRNPNNARTKTRSNNSNRSIEFLHNIYNFFSE